MTVRYILKTLVLPPLGPLLLLLTGLLAWRKAPRFGLSLAAVAGLSLWVLVSPWCADALMNGLENRYSAVRPAQWSSTGAEAIVVLSGGMDVQAREFGYAVGNGNTLKRVRYGAFVQQKTGLPLLVSGGNVYYKDRGTLAAAMKRVLESQFGADVRWTENRSRNTWENARYSAEILEKAGIERVALVTEAFHMPRSVFSFERNGIDVVPAPTGFFVASDSAPLSYLPTAQALQQSNLALHEYLGLWVYRLRH